MHSSRGKSEWNEPVDPVSADSPPLPQSGTGRQTFTLIESDLKISARAPGNERFTFLASLPRIPKSDLEITASGIDPEATKDSRSSDPDQR